MRSGEIFRLLKMMADSRNNPVDARRAWNQLYVEYDDAVYYACKSVARRYGIDKRTEQIEDLAHDVWEMVAEKAHTFDSNKSKAKTDEKKFLNWISAIAARILLQGFRKPVPVIVEDVAIIAIATIDIDGTNSGEEVSENQQKLCNMVREYLDSLQEHESDILLTTLKYRPYNVPVEENMRIRKAYGLSAANIRQIRRRILIVIGKFLLDKDNETM